VTSDDNYRLTIVAIRSGDLETLRRLLTADPELASSTLGGVSGGRTALHVVTDWPGYYPKGPAVARLLIDAGADVNARGRDGRGETPLHWAASSDDVDVAEVLVDAGADLEAPDGSIGTPMDNAIGYGCWNVARLLVERGAKVDKLWHAAALGMIDRLAVLLAVSPGPEKEDISQAFWHACNGAQRRAAELLLDHGADLNWIPDYAHGTPLDVARMDGTRRGNVIQWLESRGAQSKSDPKSTPVVG
jgi:ankyrin repeat protein